MTVAERMFPVIGWRLLGEPPHVPWSLLAPHERQAVANHDQNLEVLASRGGLSVSEMVAVIDGLSLRDACKRDIDTISRLSELLVAHAAKSVTATTSQQHRDNSPTCPACGCYYHVNGCTAERCGK